VKVGDGRAKNSARPSAGYFYSTSAPVLSRSVTAIFQRVL
jgi:hypothetical protein